MRALTIAVCLCLLPLAARAQAVDASAWQVRGIGPDGQLLGGGGFGLDESVDNNFLGRLRLGMLYADEPWLYNFGVTGEIGGLADWGFGGEVEVNHFKGVFAGLGLGTAELKDVTGHVTAGFMIFGVEYQFRARAQKASHALMFVVRAPVGMWWMMTQRRKQEEEEQEKARGGDFPAVEDPSPNEPLAQSLDSERIRAESERTRSRLHVANGDLAGAIQALKRSHVLSPQPALFIDMADLELAQGHVVAAIDVLERFLKEAQSDADRGRIPEVQQRLEELRPRVGRLRLQLDNVRGGEQVHIDASDAPGAVLGYDVRLDPGNHVLTVFRQNESLARRSFSLADGQLLRLRIDLEGPAEPQSRTTSEKSR